MLEQPYIVLFNTEEEFKEFFPFIKEHSGNRNSWTGDEFNLHENFAIQVEEYFSRQDINWYNKNGYENIKRYTYQEWKRLQNKDLIIENFEFC